MTNHPPPRHNPILGRVLTLAIVCVLLVFFSVPIAFILIGGGAAAIGGLVILGALIVLQLPMFMLLKKIGALPPVDRDDERP